MSHVSSINSSISPVSAAREAAHPTAAPRRAGDDSQAESHIRAADSVDFSSRARELGSARPAEPFRADLVARIRAEIAAGTYETDEKLDITVDRLGRDLDVRG